MNLLKYITLFLWCFASLSLNSSGGQPSRNCLGSAPNQLIAAQLKTHDLLIASTQPAMLAKKSALAILQTQSKAAIEHQWPTIMNSLLPLKSKPLHTLNHKDMVRSVAFNHNGTRFATASNDKTACLWDAHTGDKLLTLNHKDWVNSVAFNYNGTRVATASADCTACLWDAQTGVKLYTLNHKDRLLPVAFNHDGTRVATASFDGTACLWDAQTGKKLYTLNHNGRVRSVAFNHDGTRVATASEDNTACLWNAHTGDKLRTLNHNDWVRSVAFNHDGTRVATASLDGTACLWDAQTGKKLYTLNHNGGVNSVAFNHDGTRVATASDDKTACLWDAQTGKKLYTLNHNHLVLSVAFNHDGTRVATASGDKTACLWNAHTGDKLRTLNHNEWVLSVAFNHDGTRFATASFDRTARLWNIQHLADPVFQVQLQQLKDGTLAAEQLMLIYLFAIFKQQRDSVKAQQTVIVSLKEVAQYCAQKFQSAAITTAALTRILITFHPAIMDGILLHYGISLIRPTQNIEEIESPKAYEEVLTVVHQDPQGNIAKILGEYIVDKYRENYIDSCAALDEAVRVTQLSNAPVIHKALEEYIVGDHPTITPVADSSDLEHARKIELGKKQQEKEFREATTQRLFTAIKAGDLKGVKENLNPVSVIDRNPHENLRTPLMQAIWHADPTHQNDHEIFKALLEYKELLLLLNGYHHEMGSSDLAATDFDGNTPLMLAILKNCFNFALRIAQKIDADSSLHAAFAKQRAHGNKQESAYGLALQVKEYNKDNPDFKGLMAILEKHRKQEINPSAAAPKS